MAEFWNPTGIMSDQRSPLVSDPDPASGTPQGPRRAVYTSDRVIIRDDRVASLRRQLQAATVAFNEAEKQYRHAQALALVSA
jgi:hypothetical protein